MDCANIVSPTFLNLAKDRSDSWSSYLSKVSDTMVNMVTVSIVVTLFTRPQGLDRLAESFLGKE